MNEEQKNIMSEVVSEVLDVLCTPEKAAQLYEAMNATYDQMNHSPVQVLRTVEKHEQININAQLSFCCNAPIEWEKLSGSLGHGRWYCGGCGRSRTV